MPFLAAPEGSILTVSSVALASSIVFLGGLGAGYWLARPRRKVEPAGVKEAWPIATASPQSMIQPSSRVLLGRQVSGLKEVALEEGLGDMMQACDHAALYVPMAASASPFVHPSIFKGVVQPAQVHTPAPLRTCPSTPEALPPVLLLPGQSEAAVGTPELISPHLQSAAPVPLRATRLPPPLPPFPNGFQQAATARRVEMAKHGLAVQKIFRNPRTEKWQEGPEAQNWGQGWEVSYQLKRRG